MSRATLPAFDLRAARKAKGLSQVAVAEILCTSQPSVARWESKGNLPAIYRKAWAAHWELEAKTNDTGPNKRTGKSSARSSEVGRSTKRTRRSVEGLSESEAGSKSKGSIDTTSR